MRKRIRECFDCLNHSGESFKTASHPALLLQGGTADSQRVSFTTSSTQYNLSPVQSNITGAPPPPRSSAAVVAAATCAIKCKSATNIVCFAKNKCWKAMGAFAALLAAIAAAGEPKFWISW